jgi:hypothetical protein
MRERGRDARDADFCTNYNRTLEKAFARTALATLVFNFKLNSGCHQQTHFGFLLQSFMCRSFRSPLSRMTLHVTNTLNIRLALAYISTHRTFRNQIRNLSLDLEILTTNDNDNFSTFITSRQDDEDQQRYVFPLRSVSCPTDSI